LPVVMMSGYAEHEVLDQFAGGGPAGFLQKPFNVDAIRHILQTALGGASQPVRARP
jgi:FixJ family two-component response regulator